MTNEEIAVLIAKMQYQISAIGRTVDHKQYPVESLIVEFDWGQAEISLAHDIFEKWDKKIEAGESLSTGRFEADFAKELNIGYQELKSVVNAFYKNGQWTGVCEAYVDAFGDNPSIEYSSIKRRERF
jgi:hypothetical protein